MEIARFVAKQIKTLLIDFIMTNTVKITIQIKRNLHSKLYQRATELYTVKNTIYSRPSLNKCLRT